MATIIFKKEYIKDGQGNYVIPYVNSANINNLGVICPDGRTVKTDSDGIASVPLAIEKYSATVTYAIDDVVMAIDNHQVKIYRSLVDDNTGYALTDTNYWITVPLGGNGTVLSVNNITPDSNGNITLAIPVTTSSVTSGSTDALTSGGAYTALLNKEDAAKVINVLASSGTIALADNSINTINLAGNVTFTLPAVTDNTVFHQILVQVNLSTAVSIDAGTTYYFNKTAPDMSGAGVYNLVYEYDKANQYWVCGVIGKGASA